jgi:hypothetical protein
MITPPDSSTLYRSAVGYESMKAHYDAALQGLGVAYESRYAETSLGPVHAVACGNETGKLAGSDRSHLYQGAATRMIIPTITTPRLILRPFGEEDAAALTRILNQEGVLRYFPATDPPARDRVLKMIQGLIEHWHERGCGLWAVEST